MNTDHVQYLIEISKTRSMLKASEKLYLTPQALSKAMAALEKELQMPLLNRSTSGVSLTANGLWLVDISQKYLNAVAERQQSYFQYLGNSQFAHTGPLVISIERCCTEYTPLFEFIADFTSKNTELDLTLNELSKKELLDAVAAEELPFGFIYRFKAQDNYIDDLDPRLTFTPFDSGDLFLLISQTLINGSPKSISFKKACLYPLCTYSADSETFDQLALILSNAKIHSQNINSLPYFKAVIKNGQYATLIARFKSIPQSLYTLNSTQAVKIRDDVQVILGLVRSKDEHLQNNEDYFISSFRSRMRLLMP